MSDGREADLNLWERLRQRAGKSTTLRRVLAALDSWYVVGGLILVSLGLGWIGFRQDGRYDDLEALYRAFGLFTFSTGALEEAQASAALDVARFLAPIAAVLFAADALREFVKRVRGGQMLGASKSVTAVVCGFGRTGQAIRTALPMGTVAVVDPDAPIETEGFLRGDATDEATLRAVGVEHVDRVFVACGDDGTTATVVATLLEMKLTEPPEIIAVVEDPALRLLLRGDETDATTQNPRLESPRQHAANRILDLGCTVGGPDASILLVGAGRVGQTTVRELIRRRGEGEGPRGQCVAVDRNAEVKVSRVTGQHDDEETCSDICGITLEFDDPAFTSGSFWTQDTPPSLTFVTVEDEALALRVGTHLEEHFQTPTVIRVGSTRRGLAWLFIQRRRAEDVAELMTGAARGVFLYGGREDVAALLDDREAASPPAT